MPKTKAEKIIFGIIMSLFMVYGMEVYNQALLHGGLINSGFGMDIKELLGLSLVVFVIENLYGGALARKLAFKVVTQGKDREIFVIVAVQIFTVCVMCPSMSMVASIIFKGALQHGVRYFFAIWVQTVAMNIPMAVVWQLAVCGPLVRAINRKIIVPMESKIQAHSV